MSRRKTPCGNPWKYNNGICRCPTCTRAWADYCAQRYRIRTGGLSNTERFALRRAEAEARDNHGTETRYNFGCRCDECRRASGDARRRRRQRAA